MSFLKTVKHILYKPKDFFEESKKIKGFREPVKFLIIFTLIVLLFLTFYYINNINQYTSAVSKITGMEEPSITVELNLVNYLIIYVIYALLMIGFSFVKYWVVHFYVKLFNRKAEYADSYKALTYSFTPGYISMIFFVLAFFALLLAQKTGSWLVWVLFAILSILFIILELYSIYLRCMAMNKIQGISLFKSFLCIYLFGLPTFIIVIFILELILFFLVFGFLFATGILDVNTLLL
jgi:hypothetical protein